MRKNIIKRYTDIPALIRILRNRKITFLSPTSWDDRNDRNFMEAYKRRKRLKTLLTLCFSEAPETYHHWRVFAPGNSGVCIEFFRDDLLDALPEKGFVHSPVSYRTLLELSSSKIGVEDLPFTKRRAFSDEREFRIVYSSKNEDLSTKDITIDLSTIYRIAVNPWLPEALFDSTLETIKSIDGCSGIRVYQSSLIENTRWKQFAGKYV